jgi:hypothetical protein
MEDGEPFKGLGVVDLCWGSLARLVRGIRLPRVPSCSYVTRCRYFLKAASLLAPGWRSEDLTGLNA